MHFSTIASIAFIIFAATANATAVPTYNGLVLRQEQSASAVNGACDKIQSALKKSGQNSNFLSSAFKLVETAATDLASGRSKTSQDQSQDEKDPSILSSALDALKSILGDSSSSGLSDAFSVIEKVISAISRLVKRDEELQKRQLGGIMNSALTTIEKNVIGKAGSAVATQAFSAISKPITNAISGVLKREDDQASSTAPVNATEVQGHMNTLESAVNDSGAGTFVKEAPKVVKGVVENIVSSL